jgi:phosphohistidine swiveling domain-containing protein
MIAAVAWRHRAALLACDADLHRVAAVIGIELDQPTQAGSPARTAGTVRGTRTTFR